MVSTPSFRTVTGGTLLDKPTFGEKLKLKLNEATRGTRGNNYLSSVFDNAARFRQWNQAAEQNLQQLRNSKREMLDTLSDLEPTNVGRQRTIVLRHSGR